MKTFKIISVILTISVLMLSCKKEEIIEEKTKLLPSEIIGLTENTKEIITYNEDNMIISYESVDNDYDENEIYTIEYVNKKPSRFIENAYGEIIEYNITYSNDGTHVYLTDTRNESENIASNYNLTIDKWGNLLLLYVDEPAEFEDYEINYEYDKLNNWTFYSQSGRTFEYDTTKKGIFVNSATPNWVSTYYSWFVEGIFSPNLLVKSVGLTDNSRVNIYEWSEYNDDGYSEKLTIKLSDSDEPLEYKINYIEAK